MNTLVLVANLLLAIGMIFSEIRHTRHKFKHDVQIVVMSSDIAGLKQELKFCKTLLREIGEGVQNAVSNDDVTNGTALQSDASTCK